MKKIVESSVLLNVLCLEDDLNDAELLNEMLINADYKVSMDIAKNKKEYIDFLKGRNYDIIFADNSVTSFDALAALKVALELKPEIPFICVSGTIGEEKAVELLKQGASDYVTKDRMNRFVFAVQRALKEVEIKKEKNQVEIALRESEEKYSKAFQSSPYAIAITNVEDGKFIEINDAFASVTGYSKEEVIGRTTVGLNVWVNTVDRDWVFATLLDGKNIAAKEFLLRSKDGVIHTVLYYAKIIHFKSKPCIITSLYDITERKISEETLKKSEKEFRNIYDNAIEGMFRISMEGNCLKSNTALATMLGYKDVVSFLKTVKCFGIQIWLNSEERLKYSEILEKHGIIRGYECQFKRKNGEIIWVSLNSRVVCDENGEILYYEGFLEDISKRKLVEDAIINERKTLRTLIDNLPDVIYVKDIDCRKVIANKADVLNIGFNKEADVLGKTDIELFQGQVGLRGYNDDKNVISSGKAILEREEDFVDKNGEKRWLLTSKIPLQNKDGIITGLIGIGHDVTGRKMKEQTLIKAMEQAEQSNRLKSAFLTNMSHEIRTPMNGILGFTELLKEPNLSSDDQQDFIQTIQISGARMLNTINSIVDISKIESGLVAVDIKETDINEKMEFTYKFFKPEIEKKGLQFRLKNGLPSKEAIIKTDNEKVYGILTNLVRNALKFTFDGSIEFGYEKKGEFLEFYVKDTGVGIPDNQKELIFERFRQGSDSHNRGYEGSGLGLSISKSYVEMLGGKIWVESEEGLGSTFYFTIPYNTVLEEKTETISADSSENKEVQLKNLKVLIVEDDEISYSLLSLMLKKISSEVLHAVTGVQAIEACRSNPDLDLVLMDIRMPKMDGNEATRQIRQFNNGLVIIAQTAFSFDGDREKAIEAGCNDYIAKPINSALLFELIKQNCNR